MLLNWTDVSVTAQRRCTLLIGGVRRTFMAGDTLKLHPAVAEQMIAAGDVA